MECENYADPVIVDPSSEVRKYFLGVRLESREPEVTPARIPSAAHGVENLTSIGRCPKMTQEWPNTCLVGRLTWA